MEIFHGSKFGSWIPYVIQCSRICDSTHAMVCPLGNKGWLAAAIWQIQGYAYSLLRLDSFFQHRIISQCGTSTPQFWFVFNLLRCSIMRTLPVGIVSNNGIIIQNGNCMHKEVRLVEMQKLRKCKNPMLQHRKKLKIENRNRPLGGPFLLSLSRTCSPHHGPCVWKGRLAGWYRNFRPGGFDIGLWHSTGKSKIATGLLEARFRCHYLVRAHHIIGPCVWKGRLAGWCRDFGPGSFDIGNNLIRNSFLDLQSPATCLVTGSSKQNHKSNAHSCDYSMHSRICCITRWTRFV